MSFARHLTDRNDLEGQPNHHPMQMKDLHLLQAWPSREEAGAGVGLGARSGARPSPGSATPWLSHGVLCLWLIWKVGY